MTLKAPEPGPRERVGVLVSDNANGTVNIDLGGAMVTSIPCDPSYAPRIPGDRVNVSIPSPGLMRVTGVCSGPAGGGSPVTYSTPGAPYQATTGVFVDIGTGRVRYQVAAPAAPTTGTTGKSGQVTRTPSWIGTWRGGSLIAGASARQGSWGGYGPDTGAAGGYDLSALAGKKLTKAVAVLHRVNAGGVIGAQDVQLGFHAHTSQPSGTPVLTGLDLRASLARDETGTAVLPVAEVAKIRDNGGGGLGVSGPAWVDLDRMDLIIDWSD